MIRGGDRGYLGLQEKKKRVLCCIFVEIIQIYTFRKMAYVLE